MSPLDPRIAKGVVLAVTVAMIAIRAPHGQRSRSVRVVESRRGALEVVLLALAWIAFVLPLVWIATSALAAWDYPLRPLPLGAGVVLLVGGLWLFHRAHADLGPCWSITLELREGHRLVTEGVYARIRHPMYAALLAYSAGFALVLPNRIAGPAYLVAMVLLVAFRLGPEERMMREAFGDEFRRWAARTKRLVPGIW